MIELFRYPRQRQAMERKLFASQEESQQSALGAVREIIENVRRRGDEAVLEYTLRFDGALLTPETMLVSEAEFEAAYAAVSADLTETLRNSAANIRSFHEKQLQKTWLSIEDGKTVGQLISPLGRVGVYVPGGQAAYPSSVLMNVLPAKVAGVSEIMMVSPMREGKMNPLTLVAAREAGADKVIKIGGAQAVAALAYGTETIPNADKITGPGNIYVALAKREVYGQCGIDMIAGPSEILIIADESASARFVAADMLSQAEHDPLARAILLTPCEALAFAVQAELEAQLSSLTREGIASQSIENHGAVVIVSSLSDAFDIAAEVAPEHMELCIRDPFEALHRVHNAGAVFLGSYSPEPLGDYYAGPNHVLPTAGTARFSSPLSVDDFIRKTSVISYSESALRAAAGDIRRFATAEGLDAHAKAVAMRFE